MAKTKSDSTGGARRGLFKPDVKLDPSQVIRAPVAKTGRPGSSQPSAVPKNGKQSTTKFDPPKFPENKRPPRTKG